MGNPTLSHSVVVVALLVACSPAGGPFDSEGEPPMDPRIAYAPDPELKEDTEKALRLLSDATGLNFHIDPRGTPIRLVPKEDLYYCMDGGEEDCDYSCAQTGLTLVNGWVKQAVILVSDGDMESRNCLPMVRTLGHELIHSARRNPSNIHSTAGLFKAKADKTDWLLEESSLLLLCDAVPCATFQPETP